MSTNTTNCNFQIFKLHGVKGISDNSHQISYITVNPNLLFQNKKLSVLDA